MTIMKLTQHKGVDRRFPRMFGVGKNEGTEENVKLH